MKSEFIIDGKGEAKIEQINLYNVNRAAGERKQFIISGGNLDYYNAFLDRFDEKSRRTYKVSVGQFLEDLGPYDFAKVSPEKIRSFADGRSAGQRRNTMSHLRSMLSFIAQNNINGAAEKVKRETLIWLLDGRAAKVCKKML